MSSLKVCGRTVLIIASIFNISLSAGSDVSSSFYRSLKKQLSVCEAYQLSEKGYLRVTHSRQYKSTWTLHDIVHDMIPEMAKRRKIDIRSTLHLTAAHASSGQTAKALLKVAKTMDEQKLTSLKRVTFLEQMERIFKEKTIKEGVATCLNLKWGNFYPDFHAFPIAKVTIENLRELFLSPILVSDDELQRGRALQLGLDEIAELKKIGQAVKLYENQNEFMKNDVGGFEGNPFAIYGNGEQGEFVCTDEMTTHTIFLEFLNELGFLKKFQTREGKFAHRRPRIFADHFGILLFSKENKVVVLDPWVRDGGVFPIIVGVDEWFDKKEVEAALFSTSPSLGVEEKSFQVSASVKDDREVPGRENGTAHASKFNLSGLGPLTIKY